MVAVQGSSIQSFTIAYRWQYQFINTITGFETDSDVGHNLYACTRNVRSIRLSIPEMFFGDLVLVDTPGLGFEYNHQEDVDILKMVADWLQSTYVFVAVNF